MNASQTFNSNSTASRPTVSIATDSTAFPSMGIERVHDERGSGSDASDESDTVDLKEGPSEDDASEVRGNGVARGLNGLGNKLECERFANGEEQETAGDAGSDQTYDDDQSHTAYSHTSKRVYADDEEEPEEEEDEEDDNESIVSEASTDSYEEENDEQPATDPNVVQEIEDFQRSFRAVARNYRLINKIGEGTFSSVYKAEDLHYDRYENHWDMFGDEDRSVSPPPAKRRRTQSSDTMSDSQNGSRPKYVAIKKIYVTSSPARIQNELELLHDLSGCDTVVPLITAFRHQDQVVAILPYFKHIDFREYFRRLTIPDIRLYFRSLFSALAHVHEHQIIHRDIKPTNFLYDVKKGRGVLVDFGLAEREGTDATFCSCQLKEKNEKKRRIPEPPAPAPAVSQGYPKNDSRPSRRANRAGTRGFRAPEVLFKCTSQSTKLDIWSAGVILLTILSKRFPFFNSSDDVDALIEIATIFGKAKMRQCAALHGCVFETTIPTIGEKGFTLKKIVLWATNRTHSGSSADNDEDVLSLDEAEAIEFMQGCFELDPSKRISAEEALNHPFLADRDEGPEGQ